MSRSAIAAIVLTLALTPVPAFAQVDLSGQWAAFNMHDARTRGPGPDLVDWSTIPLSEEGRQRALAYSYSMISMPERMCMHWSQNYIAFAPHAIMIERINDPVNGNLIGIGVSSGGSDRAPMPIWLDGRPRPSPNANHTFGGFTLGRWNGGSQPGERPLLPHHGNPAARHTGHGAALPAQPEPLSGDVRPEQGAAGRGGAGRGRPRLSRISR
jgi:hypothetical protein